MIGDKSNVSINFEEAIKDEELSDIEFLSAGARDNIFRVEQRHFGPGSLMMVMRIFAGKIGWGSSGIPSWIQNITVFMQRGFFSAFPKGEEIGTNTPFVVEYFNGVESQRKPLWHDKCLPPPFNSHIMNHS